jgi:hypothetical protein
VLVAHGAGQPLHAPLPDDKRAGGGSHHSRSAREWLLLPSLGRQTDARFDASGSKQQWLSVGSNIHRLGFGYPSSSDKSRTTRSTRPSIVSLPPVRLLHFPDLVLSPFAALSGVIA